MKKNMGLEKVVSRCAEEQDMELYHILSHFNIAGGILINPVMIPCCR